MKIVEPRSKSVEIPGAFELSRASIERILRAMDRNVPVEIVKPWRPRAAKFELKLKDGRVAQTDNIDDLDHFPFDSKDREKFRIRMEQDDVEVSCAFRYASYFSKAHVDVSNIANLDAALRDISDAVRSAKVWYSPFHEISIWSWTIGAALAGSLAQGILYFGFKLDWIPIWTPYLVYPAGLTLIFVRRILFDKIVANFGSEAARMERKRKIRAWIPAAVTSVALALIGGGYLFARK